MEGDFLIVENHVNRSGDVTTEFKECDGKILVKHFSGLNSENFVIKKYNGKRLDFSFFKLNGIYYVNLNGHHIIDYRRFISIQSVSNVADDVKIVNCYIGELNLSNCDVDIVQKALVVMANWIKHKTKWWSEIMYYLFH
jgi:hypothetical protein